MRAPESVFSMLANRYIYGKFAFILEDMQLDSKAGLYMLTFSRPDEKRIIGISKDVVLDEAATGELSDTTKAALDTAVE